MEILLRVRVHDSPTLEYMTHTSPPDLPLLRVMPTSSTAGTMVGMGRDSICEVSTSNLPQFP